MVSGTRNIQTDITVYGATGFVARHVCIYLLEVAEAYGLTLRLTLAGRNLHKLEERRDSLKVVQSVLIDIFMADSGNLPSLVKMADRSRVIVACAGPFIKYGTNVVAACAQTGTDYVDITGETTWVGRMRAQFGPTAKKSGARIVSFCGFDSIPSDISIFAAVQTLRKASGADVEIESGCTWHACVGSMNGGTLHSALEFPLDIAHWLWYADPATGRRRLRNVPFLGDDPLVLANPETVRHNPELSERKDMIAASEWWNLLPSFDSIVRRGMSIPFFMAPVNAKVVNASAIALNYGPNFTYKERFFPLDFALTRTLGIFSAFIALGVQISILMGCVLFQIPLIGKKLADWILPPGSGLPDAILEACHTAVYAEVVTKQDVAGKVDRATCYMTFQGDPGNLATAQCIAESALALVNNRKELPPCSEDGFGTPSELLGDVLLKRLRETKVRKLTVKATGHRQAPAQETRIYT